MTKIIHAFVLFSALSFPLGATTIFYDATGELSGTLNGTTITNTPFTFDFEGDTTGVFVDIGGVLFNTITSNTIVLGGSPGSITEALQVGVNPANGIVGWITASSDLTFPAGALGWNLASSIGPLKAATDSAAMGSFSTSLGEVTLTGGQNFTFSAILAPEPATAGLVGFMLAAFTALAIRRAWAR
jgi:hypothetical protein